MQVVIKPIDVWFFRDGKPFAAGEDHLAETTFPPSPFTLQGAIRTKVLVEKSVNPSEFARKGIPDTDVGYGDNFGKLQLRGPLLMHKKDGNWERLIPIPADVVRVGKRFELLRPEKSLPFTTNLPNNLQLLWAKTDERVLDARGWLPESEWVRYLKGQPPRCIVPTDELFSFEHRFGIAIDSDRGTTQEAMLYQARFVRLKSNTALWAELEGVRISKEGFLRFGGEGRGAFYETIQPPLQPLFEFSAPFRNEKRFKVVLVTPAWFSGGWQPKNGDWSVIFRARVRLVGAAIPHSQRLGGFDVAKNMPKPMRPFVPAGAVYFFEADEPLTLESNFAFTETPDEVKRQNDGTNGWAQIGLGIALIGVW